MGEVTLRHYALLGQEVARHQVARGGRGGTEREVLALGVGQGLDAAVRVGDELGGELGIFLTLHQRHYLVGPAMGLHVGEAPEPGHVELAGGQRLHHGGVVVDRHEHHLATGLLSQVVTQRGKLALQLGGSLVRNGGDAQRLGGGGTQAGEQGGEGKHPFMCHGSSLWSVVRARERPDNCRTWQVNHGRAPAA
ncbi:hypothetical protein D3C86_1579400 [compost metagenome]